MTRPHAPRPDPMLRAPSPEPGFERDSAPGESRCIRCGEAARPAILMFGDHSYLHDDAQHEQWEAWRQAVLRLAPRNRYRVVVCEVGCGGNVTTVRQQSEGLVEELSAAGVDATLVRINPDLPLADDPSIAPRVVPVLSTGRAVPLLEAAGLFEIVCLPAALQALGCLCTTPRPELEPPIAPCAHTRALALALPRPPPRTSTRRPRRDPTDRSADHAHTDRRRAPCCLHLRQRATPWLPSYHTDREPTRPPWGRRGREGRDGRGGLAGDGARPWQRRRGARRGGGRG